VRALTARLPKVPHEEADVLAPGLIEGRAEDASEVLAEVDKMIAIRSSVFSFPIPAWLISIASAINCSLDNSILNSSNWSRNRPGAESNCTPLAF
jgi:hypothetical protein